ncbi:2-hydroxyacyl-CoA dehydratase family protein [uncultured Phascolarctobacterium sp.]|jgi:benzoyl-CoA reductase/2-hydroxyglutaryl-CoA dehydratase subunit BcrC/BadD/HgdB|uniref:2-hydroxyacyl-CoA dehydratase subunit D n=1 Tax=uncultured Phascolarctobacterium sp. TaxID=512296 RepID=UPI0027DCDAFF|nr:2-hydroxyacyl-CoA dehydratase family protein [uncultured Phascolarctobacterium sp.]
MADLHTNIESLKQACQNPRAQLDKYLAEGKKVIGCFEPYTPEELVHASGMIPLGLWGGQTDLKLVKSYLPPFACPIMQANLELGLNGTYKGLSGVIIPAICDTLRCMTQNWRFGVPDIPMIPIVYPQNRASTASTDYLISEYENVLVMLATITGQMMTEKALFRTIEIYNEHNAVMRDFTTLAVKHLDIITPAVRHAIMKSALFFEKSEHTAIVKEINESLKALPDYNFVGRKVILTGITGEPDAFLEILTKNKLAVVGDDLAQESRQFRTDIPINGGGGLKRLALQWKNRTCCSLIHELGKPRGSLLRELCQQTQADGVINCLMKFCDPEEYDQPWLEADLNKAGYPCLTVEIDPLNTSFEQLHTRIQTFAEML